MKVFSWNKIVFDIVLRHQKGYTMSTLGTCLLAWRKSLNFKQETAAVIIGVSQGTYSKWEQDQAVASSKCLLLISEKTGIDISTFISKDLSFRVPSVKEEETDQEFNVLELYKQLVLTKDTLITKLMVENEALRQELNANKA